MRIGIERLRSWLLGSAIFLVLVIVGFIGSARYLRRHWLANLPPKLGADVKIDTSGVTLSHTYQGQTDYVIHAAKDVEHTDGKVALHDVWIKLCGRKQQRADVIRGDDWEYDKKAGVVRALGVVHIELRASGGSHACNSQEAPGGGADAKAMQVTTSNLIYMEKLGVAATSAPIEFDSGAMRGHAVGADYASDSGTLMLHSAVSMTGVSSGKPLELHAASAELDGEERVVQLTKATYSSGDRSGEAGQAVLHLRPNQTLERIEAQNGVALKDASGSVTSTRADVTMNAAGHPVNAVLTGGVQYVADGPDGRRRGNAEQAVIALDGKASPQAQHAMFTGAAHFLDEEKTARGQSRREVSADKIELAMMPGMSGRAEVRQVDASGAAHFVQTDQELKKGEQTTEFSADVLQAQLAAVAGRQQLQTLTGQEHTSVRQLDSKGTEQISSGDTLEAKFGAAHATAGDGAEAQRIESAEQQGHVAVVVRQAAKDGKGTDQTRVTAQRAVYDGSADVVTLTGGITMTATDGELWAQRLLLDRGNGDARAIGSVKAEYRDQNAGTGSEPAHILADEAVLVHATKTATFRGRPVRMWQGGSQVQAPVIEMESEQKRLIAQGENGLQVRTLLTGGGDAGQIAPAREAAQVCAGEPSSPAEKDSGRQTVRVTSGGLVYSQTSGEADFTGGFRAETAGAAIRADSGVVYLNAGTRGSNGKAAPPSMEGNLDRVSANGAVTIEQPDLQVTGDRMVYTASDQTFVLTGDGKTPARAVNGRGSMTEGAALRFHRSCGSDTVEVLGSAPGTPAGRGRTQSKVGAGEKREKGSR
ncbi:MAG TPA: LptA/OstA family protein [Acidobacteriaceae bacterium]|nr:LptA/OstA family protein [Acidobacteriaceae bacterium]